jgi:DNA primase large subunit
MDYTKKTQALKPWRKTIDAIEQAKIGQDDINLMIDVLKGDKNAIAEVIKRAGVDALELDTENSKYVPKDYGRDETTLAIKDIVDEISNDKEYEITHRVLSKDWDEASFREMTKNPEMIKLLHIDVKSGEYDRIQTIAEKLKVFDRGRATDLEYYKMAAQEDARERYEANRRAEALEQQKIAREAKLARQAEVDRVRTAQQAREKTVEKVEQRKAAAPVRASAGTKKVVDYLDDSDEAYEDWYKQMEAKR